MQQRLDGNFSIEPGKVSEGESRLNDWSAIFKEDQDQHQSFNPDRHSYTDPSNEFISELDITITVDEQDDNDVDCIAEDDPQSDKAKEAPLQGKAQAPDEASKKQQPEAKSISGKLNPELAKYSDEKVGQYLTSSLRDMNWFRFGDITHPKTKEQFARCQEAFVELIDRFDRKLDQKSFGDAMQAMPLLLGSLNKGRALKENPDDRTLAPVGDALTTAQRWKIHCAIIADLEVVQKQIELRQQFAELLINYEQNEDAEKVLIETRDLAERLVQPIEIDGKKIVPLKLIEQEYSQLRDDKMLFSDPDKRYSTDSAMRLLKGSNASSGLIKTPINSNKSLAEFYLASKFIVGPLDEYGEWRKRKAPPEFVFGKTNAFKPQKAFEAIVRSKENLELVFPDAKNANKANNLDPYIYVLFAKLAQCLENPETYDLYKVDAAGKPLFISKLEAENLRKELTRYSGYSYGIDAGITALATGAMLLTRNPKVMSQVEKGMSRIGVSTDHLAVKTAGIGAMLGTGVVARHYAFEGLTGVEESWSSSATRFLGSAAFAYLSAKTLAAKPPLFRAPEAPSVIKSLSAAGIAAGTIGKDFNPSELDRYNRNKEMLQKLQAPIENKK